MAKIRIPVEKLPPPNKDGDHVIQFRVVSEDRNKTSAWSNLFVVKSIGQYRPLESDVVLTISEEVINVSWDTPSIYNSSSALPSASISHNHTQNFKRHDTDIFVKWDENNFEYHDRVISDSTAIAIPQGSASVRVIGTVATHGLPQRQQGESDQEFGQRVDNHLAKLVESFRIFDTDLQSLTWYN